MRFATTSRQRRVPAAVLVFGILLSLVLWNVLRNLEDAKAESTFRAAAQQQFHDLDTGITMSLGTLESLGAFYEASKRVERHEFAGFASSLLHQHHEIRALAWIPRVPAQRRLEYERAARRDGFPAFRIHQVAAPDTRAAAGRRSEYYPVYFLEPFAGNERALGSDMASDAVRNQALRIAADTGRMAATGRVIPRVAGTPDQYGLVAYHPVYRNGAVLSDVQSRRAALTGFLAGVLLLKEVVARTEARTAEAEFRIAIFDLTAKKGERLLYPMGARFDSSADLPHGRRLVRNMPVCGRSWQVAIYSGSAAVPLPRLTSWLAGWSAVALSGLLAAYLYSGSNRRLAIEHTVAERTEALNSVLKKLDYTNRALQKSWASYRKLVDVLPDAVWLSRDRIIVLANRAAAVLFKVPSAGDLIGRPVTDFLAADSGLTADDLERRINQTETQLPRMELRMLCADGSPVEVEASVCSFQDEFGLTVQAVFRDVSERRRHARELLRSKELAEAASRAKSQFLATMSHEIRTPMNAVLGMAALLLRTNLGAEQRWYVEVLRTSGEHLLSIINDILDFSKIEARKVIIEKLDFNLPEVVESVTEMLAPRAHEKGLELTCWLTPEVPVALRGDPGRLRQIVTNLVGNAIKFTQRGEVAIRISVEQAGERSITLRFQVRDTGIGVRPDRVAALFSPFVQADGSTTRKFGGTGLGLAISKQLVELMQGTIGVDTAGQMGSTFWFTAVFEKQSTDGIPPAPSVELRGCRVLVVDDHPASRLILRSLLAGWGASCDEAPDAPAALAALREAVRGGDPYRVALLDQGMPGVAGEELGERIAADPDLKPTALVLMAGLGQPLDEARIERLGSVVLLKPVWPARLAEALKCALNGMKTSSRLPVTQPAAATVEMNVAGPSRVLVVDDNLTNRQVAHAMLSQLGFQPQVVAGGAEAIEALAAADYDLVLMDCEMPDLDGYEVTRRIRRRATAARNPDIPILALTADVTPEARARCAEAGMNHYLAKPVEPDQLRDALSHCLVAAAPSAPFLDPASFDESGLVRRLMGNRTLAGKIVAGFLTDVPAKIHSLKAAIQSSDAPAIRLHAHAIKGASANVSADSLRALAARIEHAGAANDLETGAALVPRLEREFEQLSAALKTSAWG